MGTGSVVGLVSVLYVSSAVAQPVFGVLADQLGARAALVCGMVLAALGGLVGGFGASLASLLVARVLIGVGTAATYPSAMAGLRERQTATGHPVPSRILGRVAVAVQVAAALGLPLGGLLTSTMGWRAVFLINVPVGLALATAGVFWTPRPTLRVQKPRSTVRLLDPLGVGLFALFVSSLSFALVPDPGAGSRAYLCAGVALVLLVLWEARAPSPFLDLAIVRAAPPLARTYLRNFLTFGVMYGYLYGLTQWLQDERGFDAVGAALVLSPMGVISIVVGATTARVGGGRRVLTAGSVIGLAAALVLVVIDFDASVWWVVVSTLGIGIMVGLTGVANQAALFIQAPVNRVGAAAGMMRTVSNLAAIGASGLVAYWYPLTADDRGLQGVAVSIGALAGATLVITIFDGSLTKQRVSAPAPW